jgi:hypothetical protein
MNAVPESSAAKGDDMEDVRCATSVNPERKALIDVSVEGWRFARALGLRIARCSNYQYRSGALESVRSEVEANRADLVKEGLAKAALNQ